MIDNFKKGDVTGHVEVLCLNFYHMEDTDTEGYILVGGNNKLITVYSIRTGL